MKMFKTEKHRNVHQNSVHSEKNLKCHECDEQFKRIDDLKRHIKAIHLKQKCYCKNCGQPFPRKDTLKRHYKKCQDKAITDNKDIEDEMTKFFDDNFFMYDECHTDRTKFKKKNKVRRRL